jgi:hypothetical protein
MTPLERIEITRARLGRAMLPPAVSRNRKKPTRLSWLDSVKDLPLLGGFIRLLREWRPVGQLVLDVTRTAVTPMAERRPLTLVLVAGATGAILFWSRPWRWIFSSAVLAGFLPRLVLRVVSKVPIEWWTRVLLAAPAGSPKRASNPEQGPTQSDHF